MASHPLRAGQAALAKGNYAQAIELLQSVCDTELDETLVTQAQQFLILAYEGAGEYTPAKELRQLLTLEPQGQAWLAQHPQPSQPSSSTSFPNISAPNLPKNSTPEPQGTGFTPLATPATTGFTPLGASSPSLSPPQGQPVKDNHLSSQSQQSKQFSQSQQANPRNQGTRPPLAPPSKTTPVSPSSPALGKGGGSENSEGKLSLSDENASPQENLEPVALIPVPQHLPSAFSDRSPIPWRKADRAKTWTPLQGVKLKKSWIWEIVIALGAYWLVNFVLGRFALVGEVTGVVLFLAIYKVLGKFWMVQLGTGVAFFWLFRTIITAGMTTINAVLANLAIIRLSPIQLFYADPTYFLLGITLILGAASPWLWDLLLQKGYNLKTLSVNQLSSKSPEALKLLRSVCQQKKFPFPTLMILPTAFPVAFTYGNLRRTIRIVVSKGLLDSLTEEEIATIYAGELGHIINGDYVLMSWAMLIVQIPYTCYWQVAYWGERLAELCDEHLPAYRKFLPTMVTWFAAIAANFSYTIFWLLRLPLLWAARLTTYYSDRTAAGLTGNPNAITRSLLKIAITTAHELQRQGQTSWLLEGLEILTPLGYHQALLLGGSYRELKDSQDPLVNLKTLMQWDCQNPHRQWLIWNHSHPLMGDRIAVLNRYAQHWKLEPELELSVTPPPRQQKLTLKILKEKFQALVTHSQALPLFQRAAIYGVVMGLILRFLLWVVGAIGYRFYLIEITWLFRNANPFHTACMLITGGVSIFLFINAYFPDIKPNIAKTEIHLGQLLSDPQAVPPQKRTARMTGRLLGRRGISNWLGQDLWLQMPQGLVKLQFISLLGAWGNLLLNRKLRPSDLVNRQVTVLGWWRRGATTWIDVEMLRSPGTNPVNAGYPLWTTFLGIAAVLWGTYLIWQA